VTTTTNQRHQSLETKLGGSSAG